MCAGCDKKTLERASQAMKNESKIDPKPIPPPRLAMSCHGCGLMRLLPSGLKVDDIFELVPCPKCNNGFRGKLHEDKIEELI